MTPLETCIAGQLTNQLLWVNRYSQLGARIAARPSSTAFLFGKTYQPASPCRGRGPLATLDTDKQEDLNLLPQAAMSEWNRRLGLSVAAVTGLIIVATQAAAFAP